MAKGGKRGGSMDKPSSVQPTSMKMTSHVKAPSSASKLDMTKSHPLHNGKQSSGMKNYSPYEAN